MMKIRSPKILIFLTVFLDLIGFGIIIPILPLISASYLPAKHAGIGGAGLMATFSLFQMLFSPFWGRLSDRYGRRPILLVSLAGSAGSYFLFTLADSYSMLIVSRVLAGICGANVTAAQAYIADITEERDRTAGMGMMGAAFGLGFLFGPILGGGAVLLWQTFHLPGPIHVGPGLIAAALCLMNFIGALRYLPESLTPERRGISHFRRFASAREALANLAHPVIGPLIILFFLVTFAFANLEVSFSIYTKRVLGLGLTGFYGIFIFISLVMVFVQGYAVRRIVKVVPESALMIVGTALLALGLFALPFSTRIPWVLASMAILSTGQGVALPSVLSLISLGASKRSQGNVFGTSQSAASLARILGPIFGGLAFDFGPRWPFWLAAAIMSGAVGWAIFARGRVKSGHEAVGEMAACNS